MAVEMAATCSARPTARRPLRASCAGARPRLGPSLLDLRIGSQHSHQPLRPDGTRRKVTARGFFNIFKQDNTADQGGEDPDPTFTWSRDTSVDEVIITQWKDENDPNGKEYNIVYRNGGPVDAAAVEVLCDKINWPRRPQDKLDKALRNSFLVASVTLEEPGSAPEARRLIGTARCTSDGAFNATIWDLIVDPEFQGMGLGKALMELLVRSLLKRDISNITLYADSGVVPFYKRLGFDVDPEGIKGMFFKFGV